MNYGLVICGLYVCHVWIYHQEWSEVYLARNLIVILNVFESNFSWIWNTCFVPQDIKFFLRLIFSMTVSSCWELIAMNLMKAIPMTYKFTGILKLIFSNLQNCELNEKELQGPVAIDLFWHFFNTVCTGMFNEQVFFLLRQIKKNPISQTPESEGN